MVTHAHDPGAAILAARAGAAIVTAIVTPIFTAAFTPIIAALVARLRLGGAFDGCLGGGLGARRRFRRCLGRGLVAALAIAAATARTAAASAILALGLARFGTLGRGAEALGQGGAGQGLVHEALDRGQVFVIRGGGDADRSAKAPGAARAADAVDVILGMAGQVIVEHVADGGNVEAPRRHVRGDQQPQLAVAERFQRACALALVQIAVDGGCVITVLGQRLGQDVHVGLAVAEDDRVGQALALGVDQGAQQVALLLGGHVAAGGGQFDQALRDGFAGRRLARDLDPFGRVQEGVGDALDLGRHRGAEEQRLAREGGQLEDALDIGDEAHVQHPVGLVHDHDLHAGQQELAALEMVQQAARRRDQHIDAAVDQLVLLAERDAADQQRLGQAGMLGIDVEVLGDLRGQFARGAQDQRARHARPRAATAQQRDHRQREAGGLAGPGLRDPQHVTTLERGRDGALLDRGRRLVACLGDGLQNLGVEFQIGEFGHSGLSLLSRACGAAFPAARPNDAWQR